MTTGDDGGTAEVERLRRENEELQAEVERVSGVKRHRLRAVAAVVAVVVAVASFAVALPGAWARRTITDTDTYLSVVDPLASDPAVQEALAR
jgi:predicted nucleic acid-binding Zn ribbon protein